MHTKLKPKRQESIGQAIVPKEPEKIDEAIRHALMAGGKRVHPVLCIADCGLGVGKE
ncbi:farnesyl-diphosphate synthase [Trifolium pratense]|uniref:Farnesyl-diphosphate synthase n=1 Tax=Trifolium pratense TaxID=57577 RepID=A0A2K3NJQ6_TRIPR|nr:farnesyl-diphosphate synthase [Trifolium pratense]